MKLSNPLAIKFASLFLSWGLRGWFSTMAIRVDYDDARSRPDAEEPRKLFMFWHEMLLLPSVVFSRAGVPVLISEHRDGELITQVFRMLGGDAVRGSTKRKGVAATRRMLRQGKSSHLTITPDGPRGPRRVAQEGCVFLASRGEMQIVPVGMAFGECWRVKSWDRMALPKPGTTVQAIFGQPIDVPADLTRDQMEAKLAEAQAALLAIQLRAEQMAAERLAISR